MRPRSFAGVFRYGVAQHYIAAVPFASRITLSLAAVAVTALGALLWARFGSMVYFDMIAASFAGCFL